MEFKIFKQYAIGSISSYKMELEEEISGPHDTFASAEDALLLEAAKHRVSGITMVSVSARQIMAVSGVDTVRFLLTVREI